ncbi:MULTISPECIES: GTPase family protein [unclassified Coleofasciculus]|uniref:GTPase family protein n=1 Tax=unclassified Coleofasciculus TaxID=2692782 RepID=UPI00187E065B|nr:MULTISPECIES: GTPase [unclassified Coleofasciculus]MBE9128944.1 50S ribosome-binding GTPase [Coleofasciculus sp. LEGE 07081]MBE9151690.1 50S ribosome-binding GTPase [Coleofasciculus sp. LEGE 07092]
MTEQRDADLPSTNSQQYNKQTEGTTKESVDESWTNRIAGVWNNATSRLVQLLPVEQVAQKAVQWFSVSEAQVAEILETIRAELPTTEAILIGKPQAGKSSIVRGLTGVSAEIVGQGFRPHTQHTERYAYPSSDLPLLIFTDTVGLGDVNQETQTIIQELLTDLQQKSRRAKILILTVKINDFATDTLRHVATQLRQQYPDIPCLLTVTCLHEVYPPGIADHPAYPPDYEEVNRAFTAIEDTFKDLCASPEAHQQSYGAVRIDFTLEEDEYTPTFYGLEALRDALADLLPEAEARAIHQLLDEEAGQQIGDLYRDVARRYMLAFAIAAATLAAVPLPFATMPVLTALQGSMVGLLGRLYGQTLTPSQAGGVVSAIAGGFLAQAVGRELIKFLPGFGSAIAASWAAAYTWALGEGACVYFGDLMGGKKPDPQKIQSVMQEAFQTAQERFKGIKR